jgi:type II secretory pathway predicted ATPase ExeA
MNEFLEFAHPAPEATMPPDERARLRGEAGDGQEVKSRRRIAATARPGQTLSIDGHHAARQALRAACIAVNLFAGRRPEEVAAEIARRTLVALLAKREAGPAGAIE